MTFSRKTYQDKIKFLATYPSFEYVTDDLNEYHKLTKMIDNVEQNKKDWNLIFVKGFIKSKKNVWIFLNAFMGYLHI